MSDHGMLDYILDMWKKLSVCYKARLEFLGSLQPRVNGDASEESQNCFKAKGLYARLESESVDLGEFWNSTADIYGLISEKERRFGNLTDESRFEEREHSSELVKLRGEIMRLIEQFKRKAKRAKGAGDLQILWRGVNYLDICKLEKEQLDLKYAEDVRQEMAEKMKRR